MRKWLIGLLTLFMTMLLLTPAALAVEVNNSTRLTVAAGETVDDDLIFSGVSLIIDGTVKGDVFAAADNVIINGRIEGNLVTFSRSADVKGQVAGSIFSGAEALFITGQVDGSLVTFGGITRVDQTATVGRNWIGFGEELTTEGRIGRGLLAAANRLTINGPVAGDARVSVGGLHIGSNAQLDGTVEYHSAQPATGAAGAWADRLRHYPDDHNLNLSLGENAFGGIGLAISFGGFLAVGLILHSLFPQLRVHFQHAVIEKPWQAPLIGLLILLVTPIAAVLIMVTLIGVPLGVLSLLVYPLAIYLGQVLLSWTIGRLIADRWEWLGGQHWAIIFLAGTVLTTLLVRIPGGGALGFLAVLYGLGGLYYALVRSRSAAL